MHLVSDDNGTHTHTHGDHEHHHHHEHAETDALIGYMVDHNIHHAEELKEMAHKLHHEGRDEVAALIESAVAEFDKGNEQLKAALALIKGE